MLSFFSDFSALSLPLLLSLASGLLLSVTTLAGVFPELGPGETSPTHPLTDNHRAAACVGPCCQR